MVNFDLPRSTDSLRPRETARPVFGVVVGAFQGPPVARVATKVLGEMKAASVVFAGVELGKPLEYSGMTVSSMNS